VEPTRENPDRKVADARESLREHVEELGRRIQDAKHKLDIKAHIAAHPRIAVGIAFAVGALLALPKKGGKPKEANKAEVKGGLAGAIVAAMGTLAFTLVKNVAMHQLSGMASEWWDKRQEMERGASGERDIESFLEH
jgi:hypothetical protein